MSADHLDLVRPKGRKVGSKNRPVKQALERIRLEYNADPLACMGILLRECKEHLEMAEDPKEKARARAELREVAKVVLPYCYPRLRTTHVDLGEAKSFEIKVEL